MTNAPSPDAELAAALPLSGTAQKRWSRELNRLLMEAGYDQQLELAHDIAERLGEPASWVHSSFKGTVSKFFGGQLAALRPALLGTARKPYLGALCECLGIHIGVLHRLLLGGASTDLGRGGWHAAWPSVREVQALIEPELLDGGQPLDLEQLLKECVSALTPNVAGRPPETPYRLEVVGAAASGARTASRWLAARIETELARARAADAEGGPIAGAVAALDDSGNRLTPDTVESTVVEVVARPPLPREDRWNNRNPRRLQTAPWSWSRLRRLAETLAATPPVSADEAAALNRLARLSFGWQDRFIGSLRAGDAPLLLRELVDHDFEWTPGTILRLRCELESRLRAERDPTGSLSLLPLGFLAGFWRALFVTAPAAPTGPFRIEAVDTAVREALAGLRSQMRPTHRAVRTLADRARKDPTALESDETVRRLLAAGDAPAVRDAILASCALVPVVWPEGRLKPADPDLAVLLAARGCVDEGLPWEGGAWDLLLSAEAPALVRALGLLELPWTQFVSSLSAAPPWAQLEADWAVVVFAAHARETIASRRDLALLGSAFENALRAAHCSRHLPVPHPTRGPYPEWPGFPSGSGRGGDYEDRLFRTLSERYRDSLPELPATFEPADLPAPWQARLRAAEPTEPGDSPKQEVAQAWPGSLLRWAPFQVPELLLAAVGWEPGLDPVEEAQRMEPTLRDVRFWPITDLLPALDRVASDGDGDALNALAWGRHGDKRLQWEALAALAALNAVPAPLRWRAFHLALRGAEELSDRERRDGLQATERTSLAQLLATQPPDAVGALLLSCIEPLTTEHDALKGLAEEWGPYRGLVWTRAATRLSVGLCLELAERLERGDVLRELVDVPWRLLGHCELGRRESHFVWLTQASLRLPLDLSAEALEDRPGATWPLPPADPAEDGRTPRPTSEELLLIALAIAGRAAEALVRLGDPHGMRRLWEADGLSGLVEQRLREARWLVGLERMVRIVEASLPHPYRPAAPGGRLLPRVPKRAAASLKRLLRSRAEEIGAWEERRRTNDWMLLKDPPEALLPVADPGGRLGPEIPFSHASFLAAADSEFLRHPLASGGRIFRLTRRALYGLDPMGRPAEYPPQPAAHQDELESLRALLWLFAATDRRDGSQALKDWLVGQLGGDADSSDLRAHLEEHVRAARESAAGSLLQLGGAAAAELVELWLKLERGQPPGDGIWQTWRLPPEEQGTSWDLLTSSISHLARTDDAVLEAVWAANPSERVLQFLCSDLTTSAGASEAGAVRGRAPWAAEALARLPAKALAEPYGGAWLPGLWGVDGVGAIYRRFLLKALDPRERYGWAALLDRAESGCTEWTECLLFWALEDPAPWTGVDRLHCDGDKDGGGRFVFGGGDGVLLRGVQKRLRSAARSGSDEERRRWRNGLERLWAAAVAFVNEDQPRQQPRGRPLDLLALTQSYYWAAPGEALRLLTSDDARLPGESLAEAERAAVRAAGLPLRSKDSPLAARHFLPLGSWALRDAWVRHATSASVVLNAA